VPESSASLDRYYKDIAAGDPDAFGAWVAGAEPRVRASLHSFAQRVDTEAIVQETLLRIWQVAPRFQPDGRRDGLVRLAVRIARNLAISELRRTRLDPVELNQLIRLADQARPSPPPPDPLLRRLIERCRALLPERPRRALSLRLAARGGRSDVQLAADAGMKPNTFLQNVRRARLHLADCLTAGGAVLPGIPQPGGTP